MIHTGYLDFETRSGDIIDITDKAAKVVLESSLSSGIAVLFVPGATGALTTIEHEQGLVQDLGEALERLVPQDIEYAHNLKWHDGNGHSHIRASLVGPSLTVPFLEGRLMLGTWQQIVFLEMDNRPRRRRIVVQIMGEYA
ncbi:MAG TPA: secondary thiamine-phosphate synthase enzyme YjbQ [Methanotrichaceae archaeon]|nr:secondary thiamine-phosphate synthase enzyme YjbQ [Methanotrichaceae archaeon]